MRAARYLRDTLAFAAMTAEPSVWDAYAGAVMRVEAPGGVFWVRPAPVALTRGEYPDPAGRPIYVLTAHNPGGQTVSATANASAEDGLRPSSDGEG